MGKNILISMLWLIVALLYHVCFAASCSSQHQGEGHSPPYGVSEDFRRAIIDKLQADCSFTELLWQLDETNSMEEFDSTLCALSPLVDETIAVLAKLHPTSFVYVFQTYRLWSHKTNRPVESLDYNTEGLITQLHVNSEARTVVLDYTDAVINGGGITPSLIGGTRKWREHLEGQTYDDEHLLFACHLLLTVRHRCRGL